MQVCTEITTERLRLIPASVKSMEAEMESSHHLAKFLNTRLPEAWPPPLNDEASQRWMLDYLHKHAASRWGMWYVTLKTKPSQLVGNCGFKGSPVRGAVEIGYSIAPEYQRQGYASEAVGGLLGFAFADAAVRRVLAETFPDLLPSIGVLRKCGFRRVQGSSEPGAIRFSLPRKRWGTSRS